MERQYGNNIKLLNKQREKKHRQIMNAIYTFKRSQDQIKTLQKIKEVTKMEIDLRFKNSLHNHTYKFPFCIDEQSDGLQDFEFPTQAVVLYDLHTQSQVIKKTLSTKTLSLEANRRVKSLQKQHIYQQEQIISKIKRRPLREGKVQQSSDYLSRKNSLRDKKKGQSSLFKLPELRKVPSEKKTNLQDVVGRKIATQASSPSSKKLSKYLKAVQSNGRTSLKKDKPKRFFLQQC